MLARRLEPPGGSIYMYYGVSYDMFTFFFERTFLVIHPYKISGLNLSITAAQGHWVMETSGLLNF